MIWLITSGSTDHDDVTTQGACLTLEKAESFAATVRMHISRTFNFRNSWVPPKAVRSSSKETWYAGHYYVRIEEVEVVE
jgi:hypothetical protein